MIMFIQQYTNEPAPVPPGQEVLLAIVLSAISALRSGEHVVLSCSRSGRPPRLALIHTLRSDCQCALPTLSLGAGYCIFQVFYYACMFFSIIFDIFRSKYIDLKGNLKDLGSIGMNYKIRVLH